MKKLVFFLNLLLVVNYLNAQDRIIKQDKSEILAKVEEIGLYEVKYKKHDNLNGPMYVISKKDVYKIVYANGSEEIFGVNELAIEPGKKRYYKQAITVRPFSPVIGYLSLGYQRSIKPTQAIIGEVGIIGPNIDGINDYEQTGACVKFGYRLKHLPTIITPNMEWGYNMGGFYFQPEISYSAYKANLIVSEQTWHTDPWYGYTYQSTTTKKVPVKVNSFAFMLGIGRQMVFGDVFTLDLGVSIGYGKTNYSKESNYMEKPFMHFTHSHLGNNALMYKGTLSIGILLK